MPDMDQLTVQVSLDIEGQNWTDQPLTERERELIWMVVRATTFRLAEPGFDRAQLVAANAELTRDLMTVKQQLEMVLAAIRKTYDTVRAEQDRAIQRVAREIART